MNSEAPATELDRDEQLELLRIARRAIEVLLETGRRGAFETERAALLRPSGAFVTLHGAQGALRGCIGTFDESSPLIDTVARMAAAAATTDPRFPPLRSEELGALTLDISVLSPRRAASAEEVVVGEHGIFITHGAQRGVLLPQVAVENRWDRETFLEHTCRKAGLPAGAWRDPSATIELFSAQVFAED